MPRMKNGMLYFSETMFSDTADGLILEINAYKKKYGNPDNIFYSVDIDDKCVYLYHERPETKKEERARARKEKKEEELKRKRSRERREKIEKNQEAKERALFEQLSKKYGHRSTEKWK